MTGSTEVAFRAVDAGSTEAAWALAQYFAELERRFVGGFDTAGALSEAPSAFNAPAGLFVVARLGTDIVGCGAIQWIDGTTAEIKRMWVDPTRRGIGLGKRLLAHLEAEVLSSGRPRVVLDTNETLREAIAMYGRLGYTPIERYNDNPYAHHWFEKLISQTSGLSIDFVARGRAGSVAVSVATNLDPAALGCDSSAVGFPVCHAVVTFAGEGYDALLGWVQLVGTRTADRDERSFDIDPLRIYTGLDTPFAFYGLAPTLFDAPSRRHRNQYLDWLAHSFLCVAPTEPMAREVLPVLGFSWGFVVEDGAVTLVGPRRLQPSDFVPHIGLLTDHFPSWRFLESE